jgi:hypothetical protein
MSITLTQIFNLVGRLDDISGDDVPRERFRRFLKENITEVGKLRDFIEECLRGKGEQYNRALQDLINSLGTFLGFEVKYGRYQGTVNEIGYDGLWKSPSGLTLVIEVKTTEAYSIKTSTLVGYVDKLISEKIISDWDNALGLYVIGKPDPDLQQLENSIVAEKRTNQLRILSVNSLLVLAEILNDYEVRHNDILTVLKPHRPKIDPLIDLLSRVVGQKEITESEETKPEPKVEVKKDDNNYWLAPVKADDEWTAEDFVQNLVGKEKVFAFGERTPGRKHMKAGDWICFYAVANGIVAHARLKTPPERKPDKRVKEPENYPWLITFDEVKLYIDNPVVIDSGLRSKLDAFSDKSLDTPWAWFVQSTHKLSENDFSLLTRT